MINAFKSFFSRATQEESKEKEVESEQCQYDTFEQVTASKFDARIQLFYCTCKLVNGSDQKMDHPNYLVDTLKTIMFKQVIRNKRNLAAFVEEYCWESEMIREANPYQYHKKPMPQMTNPYAAMASPEKKPQMDASSN